MKSLPLDEQSLSYVAGGGRDLELSRIPTAGEHAAGAAVRLTNHAGTEAGLGIVDPDNDKLRVFAIARDDFPAIDGALLGWRVENAMKLRRAVGLGEPGTAYRLLNGAGDGVPGLTCDVLGKVGVVYAYSEALLPTARRLADAVQGFARLDGVVVKTRTRGGASAVEHETLGKVAERCEAQELGATYEIHPLGGLNVGLFTDMREQRRGFSRFMNGLRVLNLFSYTGALSLAAARCGAAEVTSVDTSDGVNAWAQKNFSLSGLEPRDKRWRFESGDAVRFLARGARDRESYDAVLIDPPTFSTARGKAWTLERDYPDLIAKACAVVAPGGLLWLAANTHELASLPKLAHKGFRKAKRDATILEEGGLPPDYPTVAIQAKDRYLKIALFRIA